MKRAYYPGCSLHSTGSEFDISLKAVCEKLGIELIEVDGWICCGSTPAHSVSELLSLALPVSNLCQVETMGMDEVVVPCASCFRRLKAGHHEMTADSAVRERINRVTDRPYGGTVRIRHALEIFDGEDSLAKIAGLRDGGLPPLRIACYYGCLLTRPPEVMQFDEHEYPVTMDRVLGAAGFETIAWNCKTACCGAAFSLTETGIVHELTADILDDAKARGADAIAVACPLCHANLDMRQGEIEAIRKVKYGLPIFYFTQLMGLAMGLSPDRLGVDKHLVDASELIGSTGGAES